MKKPFQSLSVKVTLVFFVTAVAYLYGLTVGIRYLIGADELRETIGYYQTSYYDYMLGDHPIPTQHRQSRRGCQIKCPLT